jgi:hypothetical protein
VWVKIVEQFTGGPTFQMVLLDRVWLWLHVIAIGFPLQAVKVPFSVVGIDTNESNAKSHPM